MDPAQNPAQDPDQDPDQEVIQSWNDYLISALIGLPDHNPQQQIQRQQEEQDHRIHNEIQRMIQDTSQMITESQTLTGRVHYLEQEEIQGPNKRPSPPRILVPKKILRFNYLNLVSHEYRFQDDEGKDILLTPTLEPNLYIRKLVERIPFSVRGRLEFLSRFLHPPDNQVLAVDFMDSSEMICPTEQLSIDTIFTDLKEQLYTAYLMEMRLRRAFRNVLQRWRVYSIRKKEIANMDPITLNEPKKPVEVYNMTTRTCYRFDATSLATWIESNLNYSEGGFAVPMNPRNPWTNVEFTYPELVSIYYQLKHHGELRWAFSTFREYQFNRPRWQLYHSSALTMRAIRSSLTHLDSYDSRELLEDFIYLKMEELDIYTNSYIQNAYHQAILRVPHHWYLEEFKAVAFQHYEAEHYGQNRRRFIHNRCDQIFKKQDHFLRELQHLGIICQSSSVSSSSSSS